MQLSHFFDNDYSDFSVYDNVRKIASYVDGLKNSQRKVVYTLLETNCDNFVKVSNLGPRVQDFSQYLHGSLEGGIVNMTQDYVGSGNNIPMLIGDGNFGTRFIPSAAATRYIFAKSNPAIKSIFNKEDNVIVGNQIFEGDKIEPKFYVPSIPLILANQQEGMSIGFAQKILPRDPKQLIKWVEQKAQGKRITANLTPYWVGQDFTVKKGDTDSQWIISGQFRRVSRTKLEIDVLPIGYDLKSYQKVLDKLVDDKVIKEYDDLSDNDKFYFSIDCTREFSSKSDEKIMEIFKLTKTITENYTSIDRDNKVVQFNNVNELLNAWWITRLEYNGYRKDHIIEQLELKLTNDNLKSIFINGVINQNIDIRGKESEVVSAAVSLDIPEDKAKEFMRMPIRQICAEEYKKLQDRIKQTQKEITHVKAMKPEDFSIADMAEL